MSNLIASIILFITGIIILYLKAVGKLGMVDVDRFTKFITGAGNFVNYYVGGGLLVNVSFFDPIRRCYLLCGKEIIKCY